MIVPRDMLVIACGADNVDEAYEQAEKHIRETVRPAYLEARKTPGMIRAAALVLTRYYSEGVDARADVAHLLEPYT